MTDQALPGRPPAHDLSAFDLSKRSPEQVAQSFAYWKAQRKRQAEAGPRADPLPSPKAAVAETSDAAPRETRRTSAKQANSLRYSAPFSDLLAAGSEPTVQRTIWTPVAAMRRPQRTASPGRRLKVMSMLAGAASVFALAGGALLELADWRDPAEVAPQGAQVRPKETPMALAAAATSLPAVEWTLQHTVDVALMKAASDAVQPTPEPPTPAIQTASKTAPVASDKPAALPERKSVAPETLRFVAKPYVPNTAPMPAAQAAAPISAPPKAVAVHVGDPRPDDLFQHGRDNRGGTVSNRTVDKRSAASGKPAAAAGTGSAVDARSAGARKGASGGSADPRGEGSGGARVGIDGEVGTSSDAGGAGGAGEDSGDGGANDGSSSAGAADGDDTGEPGAGDGGTGDTGTGGGDTGGTSAGDSGTGDAGTGSGDTGGDESGDARDGSSGDGDSDAGEDGDSGGIGGAVGGALGAVGDALDGALGGGKSNPDSNDKDQRN